MSSSQAATRFLNPAGLAVPTGYTHVVEAAAGRTVYISGQVAFDAAGAVVGVGDLQAQTVQVFTNLAAALAGVGASFEHVVKVTYFLTDISQMATVRTIRNQYLNPQYPPASTAVQVSGLVHPALLVEIEAIAVIPE
jgi:enamine deaminase RidA (YjgF/YER057c/UK114 family)